MAPGCYPDALAAEEHLRKSANLYLQAAEKFPEDDENHACELLTPSLKNSRVSTNMFLSRFPQLCRRELL